MSEDIPFHSIVIVGAGISGLTAARALRTRFPDLVVLEANHTRGGRISENETTNVQVTGVLPWPVALGPEFIHGANSSLKAVLSEMGCQMTEQSWPDQWYFKEERRLKPSSEKDADVAAVMERFESVGDQASPAVDLSAEQWLRDDGANQRQLDIADACFANDFGCSLNQLGMRETILENQNWDSGEEYMILDRPVSGITDHIACPIEGNILLDWPVHGIEHGPRGAVVSGRGGRKIRCLHVVVSVPILILQREDILFKPPLPPAKLGAIGRLRMSNAVKVIIVLDRPIWPEGFFDVVCPGSFLPELWVTTYPPARGYAGPPLYGIIGFACGLKADQIGGMREAAVVQASLSQLDEMFGCGASRSEGRHPATGAYVRAHIADWSKQKYVGGAYSYPSLGAKLGDRDLLAAPVGRTLFFAGEATHPAINPCLQAAMDTGLRAAREVEFAAQNVSRL